MKLPRAMIESSEDASGRDTDASTAAGAARLEATNRPDDVNASLAGAAAPDRFKVWWAETRATLPDDFEVAV